MQDDLDHEHPQEVANKSSMHSRGTVDSAASRVTSMSSTRIKEFIVTMERSTRDARLGLCTQGAGKAKLLINRIGPGLIADWNREHPELAVKPSDWIVAVNGQTASSESMFKVLSKATKVELLIRRTHS